MLKSIIVPGIVAAVFLLAIPTVRAAQIPDQAPAEAPDRAALVALYDSTNGAAWRKNDGWLNDTDSEPSHCAWYGVTCDEDGRVVSLDLYSNDLTGAIPEEVGSLTRLQRLDLGGNDLNGRIPSALGNLARLQKLVLWGNRLSGPIPMELGNLGNLIHLSLADNQLNGSIPAELGTLHKLQILQLECNGLSGRIPAELGNLRWLGELTLGNNQLSGAIPPELGRLSNLRLLCLSGNRLSGVIPVALCNLTRLETLKLQHNELSGPIPPELDQLENLRLLQLDGNPLSSSGTQDWEKKPGERTSRRAYTGLTSWEAPCLRDWIKEGEFDWDIALPTGRYRGTQASSEQEALIALYFSTDGDNWIDNSGWLDYTLPYPAHCSWFGVQCNSEGRVVRLNLHHNQLHGSIPSALAVLSELESLRLNGNTLSGSIPPELGRLNKLRILWLHCNELRGDLPGSLANMSSLRSINLSRNQFSGSVPARLKALYWVEELRLNSNHLICWDSPEVQRWAKGIDRADWDYPHPGRKICAAKPDAAGQAQATNCVGLEWLFQSLFSIP